MTQNQTSNSLNYENINIHENDIRTEERNDINDNWRNVTVEEGMQCTICQCQQHILRHHHLSCVLCTRNELMSFQKKDLFEAVKRITKELYCAKMFQIFSFRR